jgi:hypothetical protein
MYSITVPVRKEQTNGTSTAVNQKGIEYHNEAAKLHEDVAKYHHEAARHYENGNYEKAAVCNVKADGHLCLATEHHRFFYFANRIGNHFL